MASLKLMQINMDIVKIKKADPVKNSDFDYFFRFKEN
jgi:hypothetical protein